MIFKKKKSNSVVKKLFAESSKFMIVCGVCWDNLPHVLEFSFETVQVGQQLFTRVIECYFGSNFHRNGFPMF